MYPIFSVYLSCFFYFCPVLFLFLFCFGATVFWSNWAYEGVVDNDIYLVWAQWKELCPLLSTFHFAVCKRTCLYLVATAGLTYESVVDNDIFLVWVEELSALVSTSHYAVCKSTCQYFVATAGILIHFLNQCFRFSRSLYSALFQALKRLEHMSYIVISSQFFLCPFLHNRVKRMPTAENKGNS